jgi:hypothetical protein
MGDGLRCNIEFGLGSDVEDCKTWLTLLEVGA